MKKISTFLLALVLLFCFVTEVSAVYVNGYYRKDGTYVRGHERSAPDGNPYNNYGYPGNYNPNTGKVTGGSAATYLNNYYGGSSGGYSAGAYDSYYATPSTPTCPSNSYYDGVSSCKCYSGYSVQRGSCESNDSLCYDQTGYNSSYDSISNTCKCNYGYVLDGSGQCKYADLVCADKYGVMSSYNVLTKSCECVSGYVFNGSSCVYKSTSYYDSSDSDTCPINSHQSTVDSTKCTCDTGYKVNATKTACVLSTVSTSNPVCPAGYVCTPVR